MLLQRDCHADNTSDVLCACAHSMFLTTSIQQRNQRNTFTDIRIH